MERTDVMPDMEPFECSMNKPQFFRKAYHNLRNPIVVIKGYTSLMLEGCGGDLTDDQREWVLDMKNNVDQLLQLINSLAELSFIEAGIGEKERASADLSRILDSIIGEHAARIKEKGLTLEITRPESPLAIDADEALLSRAMTALIHNALMYSPDKGSIGIFLSEENNMILFSVADSGPGIAVEHIEAILQGFFKGEESSEGDYKGTGLGIIIARKIAELYGGSLQVERNRTEGSTFTLSFAR